MTEKIISASEFTTESIGANPLTGLPVFRRFTGNFTVINKVISTEFEEWEVELDGKVYEKFYSIKWYKAVDIEGTEFLHYTQWKTLLSPYILPAISYALTTIPLNSDSDYVLHS